MERSIDWGIPCIVCGWRRWLQRIERFVVRDRAGTVIRRRLGGTVRTRPLFSCLEHVEMRGWACRHCVRRCDLSLTTFSS